jgi:hypothetical protein
VTASTWKAGRCPKTLQANVIAFPLTDRIDGAERQREILEPLTLERVMLSFLIGAVR